LLLTAGQIEPKTKQTKNITESVNIRDGTSPLRNLSLIATPQMKKRKIKIQKEN
jgi:hypothetical protein